jgi:hypothetical protein
MIQRHINTCSERVLGGSCPRQEQERKDVHYGQKSGTQSINRDAKLRQTSEEWNHFEHSKETQDGMQRIGSHGSSEKERLLSVSTSYVMMF